MKTNCITLVPTVRRTGRWLAGLAAGTCLLLATAAVQAQDVGASLPPGVQDVVKLAHAGISDDIILAQIKNSGAMYNLTADQIIYLSNQGISQAVIKSLLPGGGSAAPAFTAPVPPPAVVAPSTPAPVVTSDGSTVVTMAGFQTQLAPYGSWINVPGYGLCWQPSVAVADPLWRPYFDAGHWVYTDTGWFWQSDYAWGGAVFHYGRWHRYNGSWVWLPGYDWAPAWVCWRQTDAYCGWAPLPPEAVFSTGVGLTFRGGVALDVDFGLGIDDFAFVGYDHFWDFNLHGFLLPRDRCELVFRDSHILNGYRMDHGRFIVEGIGHERIGLLTHRDVRVVPAHDVHFEDHGRGGFDGRPGPGDRRGGGDDRRDRHGF